MILTKEVVKGARGLLGWSAPKLADVASIPLDTIKSFESGRSKTLTATNQDALQKTLEAAGVQFLEAGETALGFGVALK